MKHFEMRDLMKYTQRVIKMLENIREIYAIIFQHKNAGQTCCDWYLSYN